MKCELQTEKPDILANTDIAQTLENRQPDPADRKEQIMNWVIFGVIVGSAGVVVAVIGLVWRWLDDKFSKQDSKLDNLAGQVNGLAVGLGESKGRLDTLLMFLAPGASGRADIDAAANFVNEAIMKSKTAEQPGQT